MPNQILFSATRPVRSILYFQFVFPLVCWVSVICELESEILGEKKLGILKIKN